MFSESRMQRNEVRKLEDIPRHDDAVLCRFFFEIRQKDGHEYETERLAVMQCWLDRYFFLLMWQKLLCFARS